MSATRVGSWSAIASGDPSGALTIGVGSNRVLVLVITSESSNAWTVTALQVGGQSYDTAYQESYDAAADVNVSIFIWNEAAIAAMSGSTVSGYTHSGTETGQNWQFATFQDVEQALTATQFTAQAASIDSLDVETTSFADDLVIVAAARSSDVRAFNTWDSLTEIADTANSQGYRHGLADGAGGENETTVVGDGTPDPILLNALVLRAETDLVDSSFTGNGALSLGSTHKDNCDSLLSAMDGRLSYSGALWTVRGSEWEASSVSITDSQIIGNVKVRGSSPRSGRFNTVRGSFVDPTRNYEAAEFPHRSRAAYVTRDNSKVLEYDLQLPMTNDSRMAQRLAYRVLDQGNNQVVAELTLNASGALVKIGDIVDVTLAYLSWSAKTFRVISWKPNSNGSFSVILREDNAASYAFPSASDYDDYTGIDQTIVDPSVPAPTSFTAQAVPLGIKLDWINPASHRFDFIDIYCSGDNAWANAQLIASIRGSSYSDAVEETETRYYWIRARLRSGEVSLRVPDSDTSTITATAGNTGGCTFGVLGNETLADTAADPADANCGFRLNSDGFIYTRQGLGAWVQGALWIGSCTNVNYEARMTLDSGSAYTTGTVSTWQVLSTTRTWELLETGTANPTNSGTPEIRRIADDVVGRNATVTMDSNVE